jgi:hypothetical protein
MAGINAPAFTPDFKGPAPGDADGGSDRGVRAVQAVGGTDVGNIVLVENSDLKLLHGRPPIFHGDGYWKPPAAVQELFGR